MPTLATVQSDRPIASVVPSAADLDGGHLVIPRHSDREPPSRLSRSECARPTGLAAWTRRPSKLKNGSCPASSLILLPSYSFFEATTAHCTPRIPWHTPI